MRKLGTSGGYDTALYLRQQAISERKRGRKKHLSSEERVAEALEAHRAHWEWSLRNKTEGGTDEQSDQRDAG